MSSNVHIVLAGGLKSFPQRLLRCFSKSGQVVTHSPIVVSPPRFRPALRCANVRRGQHLARCGFFFWQPPSTYAGDTGANLHHVRAAGEVIDDLGARVCVSLDRSCLTNPRAPISSPWLTSPLRKRPYRILRHPSGAHIENQTVAKGASIISRHLGLKYPAGLDHARKMRVRYK